MIEHLAPTDPTAEEEAISWACDLGNHRACRFVAPTGLGCSCVCHQKKPPADPTAVADASGVV